MLIAFSAANLIVKHFGPTGLWISSFALIPFDFIGRCVLQERLGKRKLFVALLCLVLGAALCTGLINWEARRIALGSLAGFTVAQAAATLFYQWRKQKGDSYFIKVNISDLLAICFDSFVFQLVAFSVISWQITGGQIVIKFVGGLLWYFILFKTSLKNKLLPNEKFIQSGPGKDATYPG